MVYTPTTWQEHAETGGKVVQEGTILSAQKMNNLENGIVQAHQHIADASVHMTADEKARLSALAKLEVSNTIHGATNPFIYALRTGKQRYLDEDFAEGTNEVLVYNNTRNSTGVAITRVPMADAPNQSKQVLEIRHNGQPTVPNLGGFYQNIWSEANAIFVQMFRAKIPVGYTLSRNANTLGDGARDVWLTGTRGTGKWEIYARMTMCGHEGSFSTGGHVALSGTPAPTAEQNVVWHVASCTQFKITDTSRLAWTTPTLMNGWQAENEETTPAYTKDACNVVRLKGQAKVGRSPLCFYLPAEYRPKREIKLTILSIPHAQAESFNVEQNGKVTVTGYSKATSVSLDGISFLAEQ